MAIKRIAYASLTLAAFAAFGMSTAAQAQTTFTGIDPGVTTHVNSDVAKTAFTTAAGVTTLTTYETNFRGYTSVVGVRANTNVTTNPVSAGTGSNVTTGGTKFLQVSSTATGTASSSITFTFAKASSSFGAYFTGVSNGNAILTLTTNDGLSYVITGGTKPATVGGGVEFFGFKEAGNKSFTSVTLTQTLKSGNGPINDKYSIDNLFVGPVPEPSTVVTLMLGMFGMGFLILKAKRRGMSL